MEEINKQC